MGPMIQSGSDLFGVTATLIGFALLIIWGLFMVIGIRINRRGVRFAGTALLAVTLSMMLGLMYSKGPVESIYPGGFLGNWISMNCELVGMEGIALFLAFLATAASLLLATDWLFIDYLMDALGIQNQMAYAGASPMGRAKNGPEPLLPPPPAAVPRPLSKSAERSQSAGKPENRAPFRMGEPARPEQKIDASEIQISDKRAAPWWSGDQGVALMDEPAEGAGTKAPLEEASSPLIEEEIFAQDGEEEIPGLQEEQKEIVLEEGEAKPNEEESVELKAGHEVAEEDEEYEVVEVDEDDPEEDEEYEVVEVDEDDPEEDEEYEVVEVDEDDPDEDEEYEVVEVDGDDPEEDEEYVEVAVPKDPSVQPVNHIDEAKEETLKEEASYVQEGETAMPDSPSVSMEASEESDPESSFEAAGLTVTEDDDPFKRALALLMDEQQASISLLQKRLGLGYFKAAKLVDQLEKHGVLPPPQEGKTRAVLLAPEELERMIREGE